ncbi:uncharacterized protein LOC132303567 [Cornus florida]|uniref:uncharacterized protein LOC132303567 n=1 Tax=Cornus florida TaxID=4283 RepID=UPI0028A219D8|nr:uncharacterized protein LOC132303567 [Cornus florida]
MTSNNAVEGNKEQAGIPVRAEDGTTSIRVTSRNFVENVEDPITTSNNVAEGNIEQVTTSNNAAEGNIEQASIFFFQEDIEQARIRDCAEVSMPAQAIMPEQTRAPERTSAPAPLSTLERAVVDLADQNLVAVTHEDTILTQPTEGQSLGANPKEPGNFKTCAEGFGVIEPHNQPSNIQHIDDFMCWTDAPIFLGDTEISQSPRSLPTLSPRISEIFTTTSQLLGGIQFSQSSRSLPTLPWRTSVTDESQSILNSEEMMRRLNRSTDDVLSPVPAENIDPSMSLGRGGFPKAPLAPADSGQTSTDRLVRWNQFICSSNKVNTLDRIYQRLPETFADFEGQGPEFQSVLDMLKLQGEKLNNADISKDDTTSTRATSSSNSVEIVEDPVTTSNNVAKGNKNQVGIPARTEDGETSIRATDINFVDLVEDPPMTSNNAAEGNIEQAGIPAQAEDGATSTRATSNNFVDLVEDPSMISNNAIEGNKEQVGIPACSEDGATSTRATGTQVSKSNRHTSNRRISEFSVTGPVHTLLTGIEFSQSSHSFSALSRRILEFSVADESQSVVNSEETMRRLYLSTDDLLSPVPAENIGLSMSLGFGGFPKAPLARAESGQTSTDRLALWNYFFVADESRSVVNSEETMRRLYRSTDDLLSPVPAENIDLSMSLGFGGFPKAPLARAESGQTSTDRLVRWNEFFCSSNKVNTLDRIYQRHLETFADFKVQGPEFQSVYLDMLADVIKLLEEKLVRDIDDADISKVNQLLNNGKLVGLNLSWLEFRVRAIEYLASNKRENESVLCQIRQSEEEKIKLEHKIESLKSSSLDLEQKISAQQEGFGNSLNWDGFSLDGLI